MAFMNQVKKAKIAAELKKVMPKNWKYSLSVHNHSTIILTIRQAPVDLLAEINRVTSGFCIRHGHEFVERVESTVVNEFCLDRQFDVHLELMQKIKDALNLDNHNRSDTMTDYFDVGHYIDIKIGKWDTPFVVA
jgi:hypothetical protein